MCLFVDLFWFGFEFCFGFVPTEILFQDFSYPMSFIFSTQQ